jgi:hypothetical protein
VNQIRGRKIWGWTLLRIYRIRRTFASWNVQLSSLLVNISLFAMIAISVVLILLAATQVDLILDQPSSDASGLTLTLDKPSTDAPKVNSLINRPPVGIAESVSEFVLGLFVEDKKLNGMSASGRATILGTLISAIGAIVTGVFALVAWLIARVQQNVQSRHSLITTLPVYDLSGIDDIIVMINEYKHATSVVVFGGDFSWMSGDVDVYTQKTEIRKQVLEFAAKNKIRLHSYKTEEAVSKSIGKIMMDSIRSKISYNTNLDGLRASFITSPYGKVLIYKVHTDRNEMHICRVSDRTKDGKELLDQFELLIATL